MKEYEIWIGYCHFGQGYDPSTEPFMVGKVKSVDFPTACLKYELKSKLENLISAEIRKVYIGNQDREWFYNWRENSNSWTGKYFETKEEALNSFK